MDVKKLTKAELVKLCAERGAELEALRTEVSVLRAETERLRGTAQAAKRAATVRYWDEFEDRRSALVWAKENSGCLKQRPQARQPAAAAEEAPL